MDRAQLMGSSLGNTHHALVLEGVACCAAAKHRECILALPAKQKLLLNSKCAQGSPEGRKIHRSAEILNVCSHCPFHF